MVLFICIRFSFAYAIWWEFLQSISWHRSRRTGTNTCPKTVTVLWARLIPLIKRKTWCRKVKFVEIRFFLIIWGKQLLFAEFNTSWPRLTNLNKRPILKTLSLKAILSISFQSTHRSCSRHVTERMEYNFVIQPPPGIICTTRPITQLCAAS